jgi:hypothetical protein
MFVPFAKVKRLYQVAFIAKIFKAYGLLTEMNLMNHVRAVKKRV